MSQLAAETTFQHVVDKESKLDDDCVETTGSVSKMDEDDEVPPGCEEMLFSTNLQPKISATFETYCNSALIGLEFVVEVVADDDEKSKAHSFHMCTLCEKRFSSEENISKHLEQPTHRFLYLSKYFPRAAALFVQADPSIENWSSSQYDFLEAIVSRIVSVKGRMQAYSICRSQWDVKATLIRTKIDRGIHLRETEDIVYSDIDSPFIDILTKNCDDKDTTVLQSDNPEQLLPTISDQCTVNPIDPVDVSKKWDEIILSDTDSLSSGEFPSHSESRLSQVSSVTNSSQDATRAVVSVETHNKVNEMSQSLDDEDVIIVETDVLSEFQSDVPPTSDGTQSSSKTRSRSRSRTRSKSRARSRPRLRSRSRSRARSRPPLRSRSKSPARSKSRARSRPRLRSRSKSRARSRPRLRSRSRSRARSRPPLRSRSRSRSRSRPPLRSRSRSRSRSRPRLRSRSRSRGRSRPRLRSRSRSRSRSRRRSSSRSRSPRYPRSRTVSDCVSKRQQTDTYWRWQSSSKVVSRSYYSSSDNRTGREERKREREKSECGTPSRSRRRSQSKSPKKAKKSKEDKKLWEPFELKLAVMEETLKHKREKYKKKPEKHPDYNIEWRNFWGQRCAQLKKLGKVPDPHDLSADWFDFWNKRMKKIDKNKIKEKKKEFKKKYELLRKRARVQSEAVSGSSDDNRKPVKFGWIKAFKPIETADVPEKLKDSSDNENKIENVSTPSKMPGSNDSTVEPTTESKAPEVELPSAADFLQVLRTLVALEDCLGSFGPKVMLLLSQALSAERAQLGSSSKLLKDDPSCIDLLDTSKEKLKGLLLVGILDGAKAKAATQATELVARLLSHPALRPADASAFNLVDFVSNLQAIGLLKSNNFTSQSECTDDNAMNNGGPPALDETSESSKNQNSNSNQFVEFSPEEITTLITHFRILDVSQQCDLIDYLRNLEEVYLQKNGETDEVTCPSLPSSPLAKKGRLFENVEINNPACPDSPTCEIRLPAIQKLTGLSLSDLKSYGIPLDEVCVSYDSHFLSPPRQPYPNPQVLPSNPEYLHTQIQPSFGPRDPRRPTHISNGPHQENPFRHLSYCHVHLDPRQTRIYSDNSRNSRCALFGSNAWSQEYHSPILIPLSPVFPIQHYQIETPPQQSNVIQ